MINTNKKYLGLSNRILICLQIILFSSSINYCMKTWQVKIFHNSDASNSIYIYAFIFMFFILCVAPQIFRKIKIDILILFYLLLIFYLISYARNGMESLFFDNTIIWTFGNGFISYTLIRCIDDWKNVLDMCAFFSKIMLCTIIVCWFITRNEINYRSSPDWYMLFSSSLLLPVLGTFLQYEEKKNLLDLILVILGVSLMFIYGARGTLVQMVVFFIMYYALNGKYMEGTGKCLMALMALMIGFRYITTYVDISSSRTLSLLFNHAIGETDRIVAWKRMLTYFSKQSIATQLFGMGLAGDRIYIFKKIYRAGYPHNILIEQLLQLGIVGCIILSLLIVWLSVKTVIYGYKTEFATVIAMFGAYGIVLFFSGSYLSSNQFFMWIAVCLCVIETQNPKKYMSGGKISLKHG